MLERVRVWIYARAKVRILVLGDSHVRVFEHWLFLMLFPKSAFEIVYAPGGTATGMGNRKSLTGAYRLFSDRLSAGAYDLVLLNLGEVDTAYTIWKRADRDGASVEKMLDSAVRNYVRFIDEVSASNTLVVLSAPLPTLADQSRNSDPAVKLRQEVSASQRDRTKLALRFNARVEAFCVERGIRYLSSDAAALGPEGVVRRGWCQRRRPDHHYARLPYAWWLIGALRGLRHSEGVLLR